MQIYHLELKQILIFHNKGFIFVESPISINL